MISRLGFKTGAGQKFGLLFPLLAFSAFTADISIPTFQTISSTCIDLASYETNANRLTVRFAGGNKEKFYRYSNVSTNVWSQILKSNSKGAGVGTYFVETVVNHPRQFPYEIIWLSSTTVSSTNKKAEDSQ